MTLLTFIHTTGELLRWTAFLLVLYALWPLLAGLARLVSLVRRVVS